MAEILSTERLIDYFCMFDLKILKIDNAGNFTSSSNENLSLNISYSHRSILQIPTIKYKENYELELESVFQVSKYN